MQDGGRRGRRRDLHHQRLAGQIEVAEIREGVPAEIRTGSSRFPPIADSGFAKTKINAKKLERGKDWAFPLHKLPP